MPTVAAALAPPYGGCGSSLQQRLHSGVREETAHVHIIVGTSDAVYATVALNQAHRIPWEIVVDDVPALLKVHSFGQDVGCDHHVEIIRKPVGCFCGLRGKTEDRLLATKARTRFIAFDSDQPTPIRLQAWYVVESLLAGAQRSSQRYPNSRKISGPCALDGSHLRAFESDRAAFKTALRLIDQGGHLEIFRLLHREAAA